MFLKKIVCLLTLTDEDVLNQCSRYDHYVIYSTFIRQIISLLFTFSIVIYGMSSLPNLEYWQALIITILLSSTLFMIDQALIGSEWSMYRKYTENSFINSFIGIIVLTFRFTPRIIYSVILALGLATLAEINIQSDYIDRRLQTKTKEKNIDFFKIRGKKETELQIEIKLKTDEISVLNNDLNTKRKINSTNDLETLNNKEIVLKKEYKNTEDSLSSTKIKMEQVRIEKDKLDIEVKNLLNKININTEQRIEECENILRGAKCGNRAERFRKLIVQDKIKLSSKQALLDNKINEFNTVENNFNRYRLELENISQQISKIFQKINFLKTDSRSIEDIENKIEIEKEKLINLKKHKYIKLNDEEELLTKSGYKYDTEYGLLTRYIGLKQLHEDEEIGETAKEFSLMIKLIIILIELSAVIVAIFFSPFSFYHVKMRAKKDIIENNDINDAHKNYEYTNEILLLLKQVHNNEREISDLARDIDIERDIRKENKLYGYKNTESKPS